MVIRATGFTPMSDKSWQQAAYPIDASVLRDMFGDDEEMFRKILGDFVAPTTNIIVEIKQSITGHDDEGVMKSAHKLKSAAHSVGALALGDLCQALETAGREKNWPEIHAAGEKMDKLAKDVFEYIRRL